MFERESVESLKSVQDDQVMSSESTELSPPQIEVF
jgi:hypothetical protein